MKILQILFVWPLLISGSVLITLGVITAVGDSQIDASTGSFVTEKIGTGVGLLILGSISYLAFRKKCPACRTAVPDVATKCNHCGGSLARS